MRGIMQITHSSYALAVRSSRVPLVMLAMAASCFSPSAYAANTAPQIWGTPAKWVGVDKPYSFQPGASDADHDRLTFSVLNKPGWMSFSTGTGKLIGTPGDAQAGRKFADITIRVSDGKVVRTLTPFTVWVGRSGTQDVTLRWIRPTRNSDGTLLTNLSGYRIYYGQASRSYSSSLQIGSPTVVSTVIQDLPSGTWYFAIKSVNSAGVLSAYSAEARATI